MDTRFEWSINKSRQYSEVFDYTSIERNDFQHLFDFCSNYLDQFKSSIAFEIVSTARQSSFISHRRSESAIFFDLSQTKTLQAIYDKIGNGYDYKSISDILRQSGAMYISKSDYNYALQVVNAKIDDEKTYYLELNEVLKTYKELLSVIKQYFTNGFLSTVNDFFVMGHETFHLLSHRGFLSNYGIKQTSQETFEFALNQCCYENHTNFVEIATNNHKIQISKSGLETIKLDLKNRRQRYLEKESYLKEEIECDMFAFMIVMEYITNNYKGFNTYENLINVSILFYINFCFYDLHFAMNKRTELSLRKGINSEKPDNIADINLRKVALAYSMFNYIHHPMTSDGEINEEQYIERLNYYLRLIQEFKLSIDGLFVMPTTLMMKDVLEYCEKGKEKISMKNQTQMEKVFIADYLKRDN